MIHSIPSVEPFSFDQSLADKPGDHSYLSLIYNTANQIIHSQTVQCVSTIVAIGVVTVLLVPNSIGWAVVAVAVGILAFAIFSIRDPEPEEATEKCQSLQKKSNFMEISPHIYVRDVPHDGNCFYSSFAVGVLEWIYQHKADSSFSLKHFLNLAEESKVEQNLKNDVLAIIRKVELTKTEDDLEEIINDCQNIHTLMRFFRETAAQGLEELSPLEKQNVCSDSDWVFSNEAPSNWIYSFVFGEPSVDFSKIVETVRKYENVDYEGWAFPQSIAALATKIPLPFYIWKELPAQHDNGPARERVRTQSGYVWRDLPSEHLEKRVLGASVGDYSKEQASAVHFLLSGNHYQVLYGVTPREIDSRCVVLK